MAPLKLRESPDPATPFSWILSPSSSPIADAPPPTAWLSAQDMKIYGSEPLRAELGLVRCNDCAKPVLRTVAKEHADNCKLIRSGGAKKAGVGGEIDDKKSKKRKASDEPDDPSAPKKKKPAPKVTKGRAKGPVDLDKQCGVINDKNLPCSRSLTCKSHSMGAKRAVPGRSRAYDELLLEWNRANNPNWVEPVKRETKAEKKEKKEREKAEKKRQALEAAQAAGMDPSAAAAAVAKEEKEKKKTGGGGGGGGGGKKSKKAAPMAVAAAEAEAEENENLDDLDSDEELDALVRAVRTAREHNVIAVPLAMPNDASSWFVARRERLRTCKDLIANALMGGAGGRSGMPGPGLSRLG